MNVQQMNPIELKGVTFSYEGAQPILRDVSLSIRQGEFVGIVAATGSGKSTLLHLMTGIIPHYVRGYLEGEVLIYGQDTWELSLAEIASRIGVVTQDPENQLFNLLVKDEVVWALENRGYRREEMEKLLAETLAFFDITELRDRITYDLSGGEKQRVVLASTYIFHPEVLVLDNPTSQLDPAGAAMVIESVKRILQERQTVIMVEDKLDELLEHVDRLIFLHEGRIALDIPPGELNQHLDLLDEMGIRPPEVIELGHRLFQVGVSLPRVPVGLGDAVQLIGEELDGYVPRNRDHPPARAESDVRAVSTAEAHLRVTDLFYSYPPPREIEALRGVNLSIAKGSFVGIIGKNGSGKTTLARCISGYLKPTRGQVTIGQEDVHRLSLQERTQKVGYVFQNPDHQIFKDPVRADVEFGPRNLGWPKERVAERVEMILEMLDLKAWEDIHPYQLSKGNRQRLAIAAIAVMEPEVLIVDEPTTGQDPVHARAVMELLRRLRDEREMTIIVITHAMHLVAEYCERVIAMSQGRILIDGTPAEVFAQPEVLEETAVMPPPVTQLALQLGLNPPPLTVDEAVRVFVPLLGPGKKRREGAA